MKTPSYSKAFCIAAAAVTTTPQASAFTQQLLPNVKPSLTSVQSSLASSIYFPGAMRGNSSVHTVHTPTVPKQSPQEASTAAPIASAATPVRKTMELIDQFKYDATVIFSIIDSDASGSISKGEFSTHLQHAGSSEDFADDLFDRMDRNGDGAISEKEFETLYLAVPSLRALPGMGQVVLTEKGDDEQEISVNTYDKIIQAGDQLFRSLDADGSGFIEFAELQAYMKSLSGSYQEKAMHKVFDLLDVDHDHGLNRHEFRDAYWRYSAFRNALGESPSS